ncbi:FhaA domain-containing protein [Arthrobacter roseus]|uniref:FhaA domain-containing protein n=1 Tax=Arthrobacter roseus TaxID=136274 RepID=UPI001962F4CF|nr:DUF3662 and FHA domain-containing protein [Arthrobacter roseus]MBM7847180.1 hypothetical protein [Arthrobacter roseus]
MGILDNVERGIEKVVRGAFSTGSKAEVQPVEIASALRRELDNKSYTIGEGRTLAPNVFAARLSAADFAHAQEWGAPLAEELCDVVIKHVNSQNYTLRGPVRVSFMRDTDLKAGVLEIDSTTEKAGQPRQSAAPKAPAAPSRRPTRNEPVLDIDGHRHSLTLESAIIGRSAEADIRVEDTGVSRRHLEIRRKGSSVLAVDLGSTNGSYVNGERLHGQAELTDGSVITMGRARAIFRLIPTNGGAAE